MRLNKVRLSTLVALSLGAVLISPSQAFAAPNDLTTVASASAAAAQLVTAGSGITVVGGSEAIFGSQVKSFTSIDLGTVGGNAYALNSPGIFLTSTLSKGANFQAPSQALRTQMYNLWAAVPGASARTVTDVSSVSFNFTTNSPSTVSLAMNFLFLSSESMPGPWDLGMVIVDGVNYAFLPGNKILRVSPDSNLNTISSANKTLNGSYIQSAATAQSLVALLNTSLTTHSITIAVADTDDTVAESMLLISSINASTTSTGGVGVSTEEAGNTPTFTQGASNESTFRAQISNYDPTFTYSATSNAGTVSISSTGLISVNGLRPDQTVTVTVTTSKSGFSTMSSSVSGRAQVLPMLPGTKPVVEITDTTITCTIGSYSATPTSSAFSLFVDGKHVSTIFSAVGEYLPDWIIPWATTSSITRTATLTSATWTLTDAYKGKSITCATLAYSKNAIGFTASQVMVAR